MHDIAVIVGQDLKFDVPRPLEEFLHVDLRIAERCERFRLGHADRVQKRSVRVNHAHAAAAAAARGLDDQGIADVLGDAEILVCVGADGPIGTRHAGDAGCLHDLDRRDLVAHQADGLGARTDEYEAAFFDALGEIGVLREKPIARMDGDRVGHFRGADDGGHVQVGKAGLGRPDAHGLIGQQNVLGIEIGGRMHGDRLDTEFAAGTKNAKRNLAAIRDDDFFDHRDYSMMNNGWPNSTGSPFLARIDVTRPALSDSIWFIIFMASMMHRICPTLISWPISTKGLAPGAEAE
jgi:hypothetical protein